MSFILSIGRPVWKPIFEFRHSDQKRIVWAWFSLIILTYDLDALLVEEEQ